MRESGLEGVTTLAVLLWSVSGRLPAAAVASPLRDRAALLPGDPALLQRSTLASRGEAVTGMDSQPCKL